MNEQTILTHYLIAALWSSTDDNGDPLDDRFDLDDVSLTTREDSAHDVHAFVTTNLGDLKASGLSDEQIGHDFWLTRNGHGAGFWDRGIGEVGDRLTKAAKLFGTVDLYVGDDGKVWS